MRRSTRYGLSLVVAGVVTIATATVTNSLLLLAGIAQVYAVGTAIVLRPELRRLVSGTGGRPGTIFRAVTVFSVLAIAQGLSVEFHFGAAIFTFGIALFGFCCGVWSTVAMDDTPSQ